MLQMHAMHVFFHFPWYERMIEMISHVYSKQPIFGLTQEWFRELHCVVHDKLHISSAEWWDILLPLA